MSLKNKIVLITGGNAGIGKATALRFSVQKARVIVIDLQKEIDPDLGAQLEVAESDYFYFSCDVSNAQKVEDLFQLIISTIGNIDILVNNAGILGPRRKTESYSNADFEKVIDINVKGVFYCMKEGLKHFADEGAGVIVNIASVAGHLGMAGHMAYSASKHAVVGMTKTAAIEYAKMGIRVNAVCPGFTKTAMLESNEITPEYKSALKEATPMKRFGEAKEIADAVIYLASSASSFMTGQSIILDGGLSVQ
jgi:NAD(P)-dependent dehydrogenase (short-subunit alcohol dehydrogenase family)